MPLNATGPTVPHSDARLAAADRDWQAVRLLAAGFVCASSDTRAYHIYSNNDRVKPRCHALWPWTLQRIRLGYPEGLQSTPLFAPFWLFFRPVVPISIREIEMLRFYYSIIDYYCHIVHSLERGHADTVGCFILF